MGEVDEAQDEEQCRKVTIESDRRQKHNDPERDSQEMTKENYSPFYFGMSSIMI
jgi:hypothetical protein